MIARLFASLRGLLRRRQIDGEIADELRDHLERAIEAHQSQGISPEEARRLALRDLGGLTQTIESTRAVRATWLDTVWRDVAYGVRVLRRSPRFTVTALTLLVLGIGSTTAIFSIAYAVLVRPLPYADAERLVFLAEHQGSGIAWPNFDDWRQRATSFDGIASSLADVVFVTGGQLPQRLDSRSVTVNFFGVLRATPLQGRLFDQSDARPDAASTAVVSYAFSMREFGSAPAALGQTVSLNRSSYTVIGVLPAGFRYMTSADVYLLLEPQVAANYRTMQSRSSHTGLYGVGRLKRGVDLTAARAEMQNIVAALALEHPETNKGSGVSVVPLAERVVRDMAQTITVLAGAVALLLLIACVNLTSLLLNRSTSRAHEFGIRAAIGGSRWSLIRQLFIEHALLVGAGGVLGALAGAAILTGLVSVAPPDTPRLDEIRLDAVVLSVTTFFCCACAFLFGVVPALRASGAGHETVVRLGRGSTRQHSLLRRSLLIGEVAVATVLLSGAGLMVHTMLRLSRVDPGFDPRNLQTVMFSLAGPAWPDARKQAFFSEVVERLRAVPGVENAAITYSLPILGSNWWNWFTVAGRPVPPGAVMMDLPSAGIVPVSATYFDTLKIPLIRGRSFDRSDTPDSQPVAIINTSLVNLYWRSARRPRDSGGPGVHQRRRRSDRAADQADSWESDRGLRPVAHHCRHRCRRQAARRRSGFAATDLRAGRAANADDGLCGRPHEGHGLQFRDRNSDPRSRSFRACVQRPHGRTGHAGGRQPAPRSGDRALGLCRCGRASGCDRTLWGHRAERERAPAGDRRTHGTRCDARSGPAAVPAARADRRRDWDWSRNRRGRCRGSEPRESRVRRRLSRIPRRSARSLRS